MSEAEAKNTVSEESELDAEALKKREKNKKKKEKEKAKKKKENEAAAPADDESEKKDDELMSQLESGFASLAMRRHFAPPVEMRFNRKRGRHLVSTRAVNIGETVLESVPYAAIPLDQRADEICHRCFKTSNTLYMCGACKHARFCSTACMNALKSTHVLECKALSQLPNLQIGGESAPLRILMRILYQRHKEISEKTRSTGQSGGIKGKLQSKLQAKHKDAAEPLPDKFEPGSKHSFDFEDVLGLIWHPMDNVDVQSKLDLAQAIMKLNEVLEPEVAVAPDVAIGILLRVQANAHTVVDAHRRRLALALYPAASYLNHSCAPNCVYSFGDNGTMIVKALKNIPANTEVTYSYVDIYQPYLERQKNLSDVYQYQNCDCARCSLSMSKSVDRFIGGFICPSCHKGQLKLWDLGRNPYADPNAKVGCDNGECSAKTPVVFGLEVNEKVKALFQKGYELTGGELQEARNVLEKELMGSDAWNSMHPLNVYRFNAHLLLTSVCRELRDWEAQADHGRQVVQAMRACFPEEHPELAMSLYSVAEALIHLASESKSAVDGESKSETDKPKSSKQELVDAAKEALSNVVRIRTNCLGKQHVLTKQAQKLLTDVSSGILQVPDASGGQDKTREAPAAEDAAAAADSSATKEPSTASASKSRKKKK